jgi:hypothetical protein
MSMLWINLGAFMQANSHNQSMPETTITTVEIVIGA